jgi:hypothetical protein
MDDCQIDQLETQLGLNIDIIDNEPSNKQKVEKIEKIEKIDTKFDQNQIKYLELFSKLPPNTEIPPSLDPKRLGRTLTQRELIKFERFAKRFSEKSETNRDKDQLLEKDVTVIDASIKAIKLQCNECLKIAQTSNNESGDYIDKEQNGENYFRYFLSQADLDKHTKLKHNINFDQHLLQPNYGSSQLDTIRVPIYFQQIENPNNTNSQNLCLLSKSPESPCPIPITNPLLPVDIKNTADLIRSDRFCQICSLFFNSRGDFLKHLAFLSPQESQFKCKHCEKKFNNQRALMQHETIKH